jgi:hypothetical protein
VNTNFWLENLKGGKPLGGLGSGGKIMLEMDLKEIGIMICTGIIWLRSEICGELL